MKSGEPKNLRKKADRAMQGQSVDLQEKSLQDIRGLVHELQVHQIELEMQNEELRRTQNELEKSEDSRNKYSDLYDFVPIGYFTLVQSYSLPPGD